MKIRKNRVLLKNKQYYQSIVGINTDNFLNNKLKSDYPISKIHIASQISLSELNLFKSQKNILLRSLSKTKGLLNKDESSVRFNYSISDSTKILNLIEFISTVGFKLQNNNSIEIFFQNLLMNFRRLDFFKVNLDSLADITITISIKNRKLDKKIIWIINEIHNNKR